MKWLEEMIDRVNAGGISGEWATQSQVAASSAMDKLEPPAIPDDAVLDLVGCLIDEIERLKAIIAAKLHQRRCYDCGEVEWTSKAVGHVHTCDECYRRFLRRLKEVK